MLTTGRRNSDGDFQHVWVSDRIHCTYCRRRANEQQTRKNYTRLLFNVSPGVSMGRRFCNKVGVGYVHFEYVYGAFYATFYELAVYTVYADKCR